MSVYNGLPEPPAKGEGKINSVRFDYDFPFTGLDSPPRTCQQCGGDIPAKDVHVRAWAIIWQEYGHRGFTLLFCGKDCWTEWATQS